MAEEREMDDARKRYEFKKALEKLELQQGDGTELITIYIPPDKQIYDVTNQLKDEYGQCANIKSKQTKTNVQSAISSILSRLKSLQASSTAWTRDLLWHGKTLRRSHGSPVYHCRTSRAAQPLHVPVQLELRARTAQTDARREDHLRASRP